MTATEALAPSVGVVAACKALEVSRASLYRRRRPTPEPRPRPTPERALGVEERKQVLDTLHAPRFVDLAPQEIYATLLDEGTYLSSVRTMYRILSDEDEVRERRNLRRHPHYKKPELLAVVPNQVWSWDITKLRGPAKWNFFSLYVILDIFSRYVVGWLLAERESHALARHLIEETCRKQDIAPEQLTIHSDRGSPMKSKSVALLLADLGVTKSHSRPHVSDDNPFSEAQFKTLKYRPDFPDRFGCAVDARDHCRRFFDWYNLEHRHAGIGLLTPHAVHSGEAATITEQRRAVLKHAYCAHPERFVRKPPAPPSMPTATWINRPNTEIAPTPIETARNSTDTVGSHPLRETRRRIQVPLETGSVTHLERPIRTLTFEH